MIRLSLIASLIFLTTFSVNANHVPETLFGIKINETLSYQDITEHIFDKQYKQKGEEWIFNKDSLEKIFEGYDLFKPNPAFLEIRVTTDENKVVKEILGINAKFREADEFKKIQNECLDIKDDLKKILEKKHNIKFEKKIYSETNTSGILFVDYDYIVHKGQNIRMALTCVYYSKNYHVENNTNSLIKDSISYFLDIYLNDSNIEQWVDAKEIDSIDFDLLYRDSRGL